MHLRGKTMAEKQTASKKVGYDKVSTQQVLGDLYKTVTMCKHSIKMLLPHVEDSELTKTLINQTDKYDEFCKRAEDLADRLKLQIEPVSKMLVCMSKTGIKMKMAKDNSQTNVLKVMLNGTFMGVIDLHILLSHNKNAQSEVLLLGKEILNYQEERIEKLKQSL